MVTHHEMQMSIFDGTQPFYINKPIRLIELFAGYGSQALALKYLGAQFEYWHISEWAIKSIQAYKDLHCCDDTNDYSSILTNAEVIKKLYEYGISANYNTPLTMKQIQKMKEPFLRQIYNNIIATKNLVSISNIKAEQLEIVDTDKYCYILTYSFPCQDLSTAGCRAGMGKASGSRSGLLWEVERILSDCKELPQVLIMENVPAIIDKKNISQFSSWVATLDSLGYKSKHKILNAKDFGIAQNRQRCFMVSVLGDYYYDFPQHYHTPKKLNDFLERKVPKDYYLKAGSVIEFEAFGCDKMIVENDEHQASGILLNKSKRFNRKPLEQLSRTLLTDGSNGVLEGIYTAINGEIVIDNINTRARYYTPRESFRLMGVKDCDFERIKKNQSKQSLYHLAGDSIVTNVLMAIFNKILAKQPNRHSVCGGGQ